MSVPAFAMLAATPVGPAPATGAPAASPADAEGLLPAFPDCTAPHPSAPVAALPMPARVPVAAAAPAPGEPPVMPMAMPEAILELMLAGEPEPPADTPLSLGEDEAQRSAGACDEAPLPLLSLPQPLPVPVMPAEAGFQSASATAVPASTAIGPGNTSVLASAAELIELAQLEAASVPRPELPVVAPQPVPVAAPVDFTALLAAPESSLDFSAPPALAPMPPPPAAPPIAVSAPMLVPPAHPRWAQDMAERVVWSARENLDEVEIQLHPPELGPVRIHLKLEGHELVLHVSAPQPAAREAFENNLPRLREQLEAQGLTLAQTQVSDQPRPQDREAPAAGPGNADSEAAEPVAAQTLRIRRVGLLDEYA